MRFKLPRHGQGWKTENDSVIETRVRYSDCMYNFAVNQSIVWCEPGRKTVQSHGSHCQLETQTEGRKCCVTNAPATTSSVTTSATGRPAAIAEPNLKKSGCD